MAESRVSSLTREDITQAARNFRFNRQVQKWTVVVDGRELPARPLILQAAGVPPNDRTNSHQAVAILRDRGFEVRYEGKAIYSEQPSPADEDFIRSLRGCCKGDSLLEARERDHRIEK